MTDTDKDKKERKKPAQSFGEIFGAFGDAVGSIFNDRVIVDRQGNDDDHRC